MKAEVHSEKGLWYIVRRKCSTIHSFGQSQGPFSLTPAAQETFVLW